MLKILEFGSVCESIVVFINFAAVLDFMSIAGVISNGCVIAFTSDFVTRAVYVYNEGRYDCG